MCVLHEHLRTFYVRNTCVSIMRVVKVNMLNWLVQCVLQEYLASAHIPGSVLQNLWCLAPYEVSKMIVEQHLSRNHFLHVSNANALKINFCNDVDIHTWSLYKIVLSGKMVKKFSEPVLVWKTLFNVWRPNIF